MYVVFPIPVPRGIELRDELQRRVGDVQEKVPTVIEQQRSRIQDAIERGKEAAARKRQEILSQLEQQKRSGTDGAPAAPDTQA